MDPSTTTLSYQLFFWATIGGLATLIVVSAMSIWSLYKLNRQRSA